MAGLIKRLTLYLHQRLRPGEGWGSVLIVVFAIIVLVSALGEARSVRGVADFYIPAVLAALLGVVTALNFRRWWTAVLIAIVLGLGFSIITAAQAWPPPTLVNGNVRHALTWLQFNDRPLPEVFPFYYWMGDRLIEYWGTLAVWAARVQAGSATSSTPALTVLTYGLLWAVSFWAGWATFRYHKALAALLPAGFILATNTFFTEAEYYWLALFMGLVVALSLRLRGYDLQQHWIDEDIDYSPEYQIEFYVTGLAIAIAVAALIPFTPSVRIRTITRAFWNTFEEPYEKIEAQAERIFPEIAEVRRHQGLETVAGDGGLPRSHLLGAAPELAETLVMVVTTSDGPDSGGLMANYRWRGLNFSDYNGRGWENPSTVSAAQLNPGDLFPAATAEGRRAVRQNYEFIGQRPYWLFALGEPVAADRAVQAHLREESDVIGLSNRAGEYSVISQVPVVSTEMLRSAVVIDVTLSERYLDLPDSVTDRTRELAFEITAEAETAYDQALALESYLRTYPYNLEIDTPPDDVDVADYFLFEQQEGYCDYYASAFIVMARTLGLPSRLAVGYAAGEFDNGRMRFSVTEADAHSWPEVYFPTYGWIPFEPTAAQPTFVRTEKGIAASTAAEVPLSAQLRSWQRTAWLRYGPWRWGGILLLALMGIFLASYGRREWRLRQQAGNAWQLAYLRLGAAGERFGVKQGEGDTPLEYAQRWRRVLDIGDADTSTPAIINDVDQLSERLQRRTYAPPAERPAENEAAPLWRRLRRNLWRLRLKGGWRRKSGR